MSLKVCASRSRGIQSWPTTTELSALTKTLSCLAPSGIFSGLAVSGSMTSWPFRSSGVTTMKMISRTRQTSTSGVTLMSALIEFSLEPPALADCIRSAVLLDEEVDQLGGRVRHLHAEAVEHVGEGVVDPRRRDGDEQAERRRDERFRDARRD